MDENTYNEEVPSPPKTVSKSKLPKWLADRPKVGPASVKIWRVIDIASCLDMLSKNAAHSVMVKTLNVSGATVYNVRDGKHWQQAPEKVEAFNYVMDASLDPKTGVPTPEDLKRFGGKKPTRGLKKVESAAEEVPALYSVPKGVTLDTRYFLEQIEEKLALALLQLTPSKLNRSSGRELTSIVSMLSEKRALLRGEPTQIVSHEQRQKLNDLLPELIKEAKRRGITIEGSMKDVTPKPELVDG